jgi:hypothetical protein
LQVGYLSMNRRTPGVRAQPARKGWDALRGLGSRAKRAKRPAGG